jgi:hypothetical protein
MFIRRYGVGGHQTTAALERQSVGNSKERINAERRAASQREYSRMASEGAPADAKCEQPPTLKSDSREQEDTLHVPTST